MIERRVDGLLHPVIMDFGLARDSGAGAGLTESGAVMGTPAYMSPEQARGDARRLDRRSDVYSLGATLYDILTGAPPFVGETVVGVLLQVMNEAPRPLLSRDPTLPAALELIVGKCLNKEAAQRYPTAQALAEDLGRYLGAQRIVARRLGYLYRLGFWARRNRALAALAAALCVSLLGLAGFGTYARIDSLHKARLARRKAELAQALGQRIKDIQWLLRAAYTLPLHSTAHEQRLIRGRMQQLQSEPHGLEDAGAGLVQYALGRGYLALHEYESAHRHLLQAQRLGVDSAELHYALGLVLGELYHRALEQVLHSGDRSFVQQQQRRLEVEYLQPALLSLRKSTRIENESPRFLEGLIAYYGKQYDAALQRAGEAITEAPWIYEARQLQASVHFTRAVEQKLRGDYDAARASLQQAAALYGQAIEIGRSDAQLHEHLAETCLQQAELDRLQGRPPLAALTQAVAHSDRAIAAAPGSASAHTKRAYAYFFIGMQQMRQREDAAPSLQQAVAAAEQALALDATDAYAYDALGNALMYQCRAEFRARTQPPTCERALRELTRAVTLSPRFPWGLNDLGNAYLFKGDFLSRSGQSGVSEFRQALRLFRQAAEVDPTYVFALANQLGALDRLAQAELGEGRDPRPVVDEAARLHEAILAINPGLESTYGRMLSLYENYITYLVCVDKDPADYVDKVIAYFEKAKTIKINDYNIPSVLSALLQQLQYRLRHGAETDALQARVRGLIATCQRQLPALPECVLSESRLELLRAEAEAQRPVRRALLLRAVELARRGVTLGDDDAEAHLSLARALWRLAAESLPEARPEALAQGLASVERTLAHNPRHEQAHAVRAGLYLVRAQSAREPAARTADVALAQRGFAEAVRLNPLLARELVPWREQAAALTGSSAAAP
ncbi:MAG: protein kinase [Polyangia bacterium]